MTDAEFRGDVLHDITCLQYVLHGARYLTFVTVADTSMLKVIVAAAVGHHEGACLYGLFTATWLPVVLGREGKYPMNRQQSLFMTVAKFMGAFGRLL